MPNRAHSICQGMAICLGMTAVFLILLPGSLRGQVSNPGAVNERLREVERALQRGKEKSRRLGRRAESLQREMDKARRERIDQARKVQELEAENTSIELALTRLDAEEAKKKFFVRTGRPRKNFSSEQGGGLSRMFS